MFFKNQHHHQVRNIFCQCFLKSTPSKSTPSPGMEFSTKQTLVRLVENRCNMHPYVLPKAILRQAHQIYALARVMFPDHFSGSSLFQYRCLFISRLPIQLFSDSQQLSAINFRLLDLIFRKHQHFFPNLGDLFPNSPNRSPIFLATKF